MTQKIMYFADPVASQVLDRMRISGKDSDVIFRCGKARGNSGHLLTPLYGHSVTDFPVQVAANSLCCSGCPALAVRRMAAFRRLSVSPMSFENSGRGTVRAPIRRIEPRAVRFRKAGGERGGGIPQSGMRPSSSFSGPDRTQWLRVRP